VLQEARYGTGKAAFLQQKRERSKVKAIFAILNQLFPTEERSSSNFPSFGTSKSYQKA
jgi:hypothetical protein